MKRVNIIVGILVVVVIGLLSFLPSRKEPRPTYAAATETRIEGTVVEVQEFYCPVTEDRGTHLVVKTAAGPVLVHVGVARALRAHNISFAPGDRIEVAPLDLPQPRHALPHSRPELHHHGVLGLPETRRQRGSRGIVLHDCVQILIERAAQARAVAIISGGQ